MQVSLQSTGVCGPQQLPDLLFRRAMAHMDLWLLRRQVQCLSSPAAAATPIALTAAMHMLHATAAKAANLAAEGEDVSAFVSDCDKSRSEVEGVAAERACQAAEQHSLPDAGSSDALGVMQLPAGVLPGLPPAQRTAGGLEAALQRAQANLGSVPLLEPGASLVDMQGMLESALWSKPAGDATAQLVLRSVERELFTRAAALQVSSSRRQLSDATLEVLEAVVDTYRNALHAFMQTPAAQSAMQPELRSREVLVVWCAYCLAHDSVARRHPMVRGYRPALQFEDLRHLVLSDRPAVDAVLAVAAYLNQQQQCGGPPLFSLRDGGSGTFGFAERFAGQDSQLQQILASERADATARVDAHWANVQQQKRELAKARQDLASLQATEQSLRTQLSRAGYCSSEYNKLISRINSNSSAQSGCKSRISSLEKPPAPVLQPLPAANGLARRWLFFLHMPPAFRCLSRLSFLGQQVLLPRPLDGRSPQLAAVYAAVSVQLPPTSVVAYYNERRAVRAYISIPTQTFDGKDGAVMLYASGEPPQKVGPTSIDHYNSPADGVWYPDSLEPHLFWSGTGSAADSGCGFPTYFNPFACVDVTTVEEFFTERLPGKAAALQWAAHQHTTVEATPRDRGNWALASQGKFCGNDLCSPFPRTVPCYYRYMHFNLHLLFLSLQNPARPSCCPRASSCSSAACAPTRCSSCGTCARCCGGKTRRCRSPDQPCSCCCGSCCSMSGPSTSARLAAAAPPGVGTLSCFGARAGSSLGMCWIRCVRSWGPSPTLWTARCEITMPSCCWARWRLTWRTGTHRAAPWRAALPSSL